MVKPLGLAGLPFTHSCSTLSGTKSMGIENTGNGSSRRKLFQQKHIQYFEPINTDHLNNSRLALAAAEKVGINIDGLRNRVLSAQKKEPTNATDNKMPDDLNELFKIFVNPEPPENENEGTDYEVNEFDKKRAKMAEDKYNGQRVGMFKAALIPLASTIASLTPSCIVNGFQLEQAFGATLAMAFTADEAIQRGNRVERRYPRRIRNVVSAATAVCLAYSPALANEIINIGLGNSEHSAVINTLVFLGLGFAMFGVGKITKDIIVGHQKLQEQTQIKREQKLMAVFEETRSRPSHRPELKLKFEEPPARSKEATNALAKLKYISGQGEQDFKN